MIDRRARARASFAVALLIALLCGVRPSAAQEPSGRARESFTEGNRLVREERWAEALAAFERARQDRPHASTSYNIGVCLRSLGQYGRAARSFREALLRDGEKHELAPGTGDQAKIYEREMRATVGLASLVVEPADATVIIDGRGWERDGERLVLGDATTVAVALPGGRGLVELDPGRHIVQLAAPGFTRVVTTIDLRTGGTTEAPLVLARLPAQIAFVSTPLAAAVRVEGVDVGATPLRIERPPGTYEVRLARAGYVAYAAKIKVAPGEQATVTADLAADRPSIVTRWWFWTGIGVVVTGAAVTTYALTREPAPLTGGGLGWVAGR